MAHFQHKYLSVNKALRFTAIGGDLEVVEKAVPTCPANEILVKVYAASVRIPGSQFIFYSRLFKEFESCVWSKDLLNSYVSELRFSSI